ncbi:MAG: AzlD domain-containing protein [Pseudomonadota bacterium]
MAGFDALLDTSMTTGAWSAILAMAAATVIARTMGFFILGTVPLTARVRRGLEALPGGVILATVVPVSLEAGWDGLLGIAIAAIVMALTRKDWLAVGLGLACVATIRAFV